MFHSAQYIVFIMSICLYRKHVDQKCSKLPFLLMRIFVLYLNGSHSESFGQEERYPLQTECSYSDNLCN